MGQPDAGGVISGLLQLSLHAVEGGDVSQLPAQRLFAGEAHGEEHEAFTIHAVGRCFTYTAISQINICLYQPKIGRIPFGHFGQQILNCSQHMRMAFAKEMRDLQTGGWG